MLFVSIGTTKLPTKIQAKNPMEMKGENLIFHRKFIVDISIYNRPYLNLWLPYGSLIKSI